MREEASHDRRVDQLFTQAAWQKRYAYESAEEFATFFQDKLVVAMLETKITESIQLTEQETTQRKVYEQALSELRACRDFCTVYLPE